MCSLYATKTRDTATPGKQQDGNLSQVLGHTRQNKTVSAQTKKAANWPPFLFLVLLRFAVSLQLQPSPGPVPRHAVPSKHQAVVAAFAFLLALNLRCSVCYAQRQCCALKPLQLLCRFQKTAALNVRSRLHYSSGGVGSIRQRRAAAGHQRTQGGLSATGRSMRHRWPSRRGSESARIDLRCPTSH